MEVPQALFSVAVWAAYLAVTIGALALLGLLLYDWLRRQIW